MKFVGSAILAFLLSAQAWDCSKKCWNYDKCMSGGARRSLESDEQVFEQGEAVRDEELISMMAKEDFTTGESSLRGGQHTSNSQRKLDDTIYSFNLKMYHELGFCWQGEWQDRKWCADCEGGDTDCGEGDVLEIQYCGRNQRDQRFLYEPISGSGGGRIKPYYKDYLCLERTNGRRHTFEQCDDKNNVSDKQILLGFDPYNAFQLRPKSLEGTCLSQSHYPKKFENIYAEVCNDACDDHTCYWEITNVREHGSSGGGGGGGGGDDDGPEVVVVEGGCSARNKCPQCYGDCDYDYECQGNLECYKRQYPGAPVPSCTGAEELDDTKDFCVPPEYNRRK